MKKLFSLVVVIAWITIFSQNSHAQLTGTKNIPGDYATLTAAITDLNTVGVGTGGVIFNVIAGNPQSAPAGGYSITATGTAANTIVFQGNGNTVTASNALTVGALNDGIFKLIGADYVTISGFIMQENAANTTTTAGSNNMTEWGVAILYATATNGAQNVTISGNTITLNRTYQNTFGIYSNSTHTPTAISTSATATGVNGGNHNLSITGNNISNVNNGITVVGPTAATDQNTMITIGGSALLGNTITNYGTTGTFSGYANVSGTVNGILVRNTRNFEISYNTVTSSAGGTTSGTLRGIYIPSFSNAPTGTNTQTINNNTISVRSGAATGAILGIALDATTGNTTTTLNINGNDFNNITHTVAATGAITLITNGMASLNQNIKNNTFTNISCNTSGSFTFISNSISMIATGSQDISSNQIVTAFSKTTAGGTVTGFTNSGSSVSGSTALYTGNNFSNITVTGATQVVGWSTLDGVNATNGPTKTISNNTFSNWNCGTSSVTVISQGWGNNNTTVTNNIISNITMAPTATGTSLTGISISSTNGGIQNYTNNTISGLSSTGTGGQVIGILGGATVITTLNISGNTVSGISSSATVSVVVAGIFNQNTGTTVNIYKNKVYDITCSTGAPIGINSTATAATNTINVYNNIIGRIYAPSSTFYQAVRGLLLQSTVAATFNLYYNTVYLDGTTPTQTYCVYIGGATNNVPNVNAINNIFINNVSSANGAANPNTVYFRLGVTNATNLASTTNNNILYCGTPGPSNLIYVDGAVNALTNPKQTLADYQAHVSSRESNSKTELSPFLNTTNGSLANYLHIDPTIATYVEGNGATVSGITDDYDGDDRSTLTPIDIGADAGNFTSAGDINPPTITYSLLNNTSSTSNRAFVSVTITDASGVNVDPGTKPRVYYKRLTDANEYNNNGPSTDGWKYAEANGSSSPFDFTIDYSLLNGGSGVTTGDQVQYFVVAQDLAGTPNVGINSGAFASTPLSVDLTSAAFPIGGTINSYQIIGAPLSGTYTVGLSMMRPLTGRNMEYVAKTRKVKIMVPAEGEEKNNQNEKVQIPEEQMNSTKHFDEKALNRPMIEKEIEETYYELQENGKKYDGPMYAEYGNNRSKKSRSENDNSGSGYVGDALGNYATITAAVTDLNNRGVSGPVTFLLIDANYAGETYPIQFNNNIGGISAVNNVTLKPQTSITATIPGNINANATIRILSNYVTIDGSNSGGTDRSLTIQNNSVTTPSVVLIGSTGTTPITNVTLKNCIVTNGVNTSSAVVVSDAGTLGNAGYFNTVTIQNNLIEKAYMGVYATGGTTPQNGSNLFLYNNSLTTSGANAIRFCGLYMQGVNTAIVSQNTISNFDGTSAEDDKGIWLATGCINATVERNNISALNYTGTGGYGGHGILVTTAVTGANVTVKNNMIYNISGDGWDYTSTSFGTDNPIGICIGTHTASTQSGINVFNNSIYLNGNTLNNTNALSMGVFIGNGVTGVDLRNNIIVNNLGLLATTGLGAAGVRMWTSNAQFTNSNYNCYSTNPTGSGTKEIGRIVTTGQTTMAGWRTATTRDAQSFNGLPLFVSATDLHIQSTDLTVSGRGNFIAGNNNDYDGDSRPTSQSTSVKPVDVGCDQYSVSAFATGNVTVLSGSTYFDNNLRAIEIMSGSFTASQVRQFTGVQTPNNTLLRNTNPVKNNNPVNDTKDNTAPLRKTKVKKDGVSGGQTEAMAVNTPWVYWEIDNLTPTTEPITLRYYYNEDQLATTPEANLKLSYWNGSTWDNNFVQSVNAANNYIELTLPTGQSWPTTSLFAVEDASSPLPVILSGFDITAVSRDINLKWSTETEINNKGFSIERRIKTADNQYSTWKEVSFVNGKGNSNNRVEYTYTDKKLNSGAYQYRLKQVDFNGNYEYHSPANNSDVIVGKPGNFDISQNYPNPSNPKSKIDFAMPFDGKVSIKVYDILGKEVATLVNEFKSADFYTVEFDGTNIASGTYFYRIIAEGDNQKFTKTMKMILVK